MGFFKKLFGGVGAKPHKDYYVFHVKCKRCGEVLEGRVDTDNDLSVEYEDDGDVYYVRKVLMGDGKNMCFQQVEAGLKFDKDRKIIEKRVEFGDFVE